MLEVEVKLRVGNLEEIEKRLLDLGAKLIDIVNETDYYVDLRPCIDLRSKDMALRIRESMSLLSNSRRCELTFKGSRIGGYPKARKEIVVEVDSAEKLLEIFKDLGFSKTYTVSKSRRIYRLGSFKIFLDNVKELGSFIEIEADNPEPQSLDTLASEMKRLLSAIGVFGEPEEKTYLEMLLEKKGLDQKYFD
ncbi:MAG: class IV adenylate cyclase [Ignisphaera sp.]